MTMQEILKIKHKASQKDGTITGKEEEVSLGTGLNFLNQWIILKLELKKMK